MSRELVWHEFFSAPSQCWYTRSHKRNPNTLDVKHKRTKKALWIENWLNHPWVKAKLVAMTQGRGRLDGSEAAIDHCRGNNGLVGLNETQFFAWHQSGCIAHSPAFESGCKSPDDNGRKLCREGRLKEAMHIIDILDQLGIGAKMDTYARMLQECSNMKALAEGKRVHAHILRCGVKTNLFLGNTLANMYIKCGSVVDAREVFDKMPERNVFAWTIMIAGYVKHGQGEKAFELFQQMECEGVEPDGVAFLSILKACSSIASLEQGKKIHAHIVKRGFESDVLVGSTLIDMYAKCGNIKCARRVFDEMPKRNIVSWNAMIAGYAQHGQGEEALELFWQLEREGVKPDKVTFLSTLKACSCTSALEHGKQIHAHIVKNGFGSDVTVGNTLVDMYAKCGSLEYARRLFDQMPNQNVVSWNAMITGYAQHGHGAEALDLFQLMEQKNMKPDKVTFVSILKACTCTTALEQGKQIHAYIAKSGFELDLSVGCTLVDMYAKCGSIDHARQVFDEMPKQVVVLWNAMIAGYAQHGQGEKAIELFRQMEWEGVKPDEVTFVSLLKASASIAALEQGKQIHARILKNGYGSDIFVGNGLVDMYAKCGSIEDARQVFDEMPKRDVVSWNAMVAGYAHHGHSKEALQLAEQMQREGMKMNHITFVSILSACSRAGLVDEGCGYFDSMSRYHGIRPTYEHYACMVDLLGRAGHLEEAENFIKGMPLQPSSVVWNTLLGACRIYGNVKLAEHAVKCILELEPQNAAAYVLLSNIYSAVGRRDDKEKMRKLMEERSVKHRPGCSHIEVNNQVHGFVVKEMGHPQMKEIYSELRRLSGQMEEAGYVPDKRFVFHDVEDQLKKHCVSHHSEKLAIVFGLISTPPGKPIRVFKNLRVCGDCHTATKFICKIVVREIVLRDANRFHHFKHGVCSCGDYW